MDVRAKLQEALADTYTIERELGGGGMSRVFVAVESRLGRRVVIKVLPAELAAAVSASRFEREIHVAAGLSQAHIVPVLAAGQVDGLPYYTMPFIEGESLRTRLTRGPLSEREAVNVLRDVARALAFAHERGIIHRDIKPDNVLLSGEAAVVTDFGIAKAISAARTESGGTSTGLTQIGTSIGTPAYMAPEQAAGDPDTDHRADLYSLGCMAFELLTGRRVFEETSPHRLMAAHMGKPAPRVRDLAPHANVGLDTLIAACLEKNPADRPQSARDVLAQLDVAMSTSGGNAASIAFTQQTPLPKAVAIWAAAFVAAWILARAAVVGIGLPDWTVPLALAVTALGLPAVLATWYVQHTARRALLTTPTRTPGGTSVQSTMASMALRAAPVVSWKRTWRGGMIGAGVVVLSLGGVMTLRAFGIGPAASLLNAGRIGKDSRVLVAQFRSTTGDTSLGTVVAQAMRTSLGQSSAIRLVSAAEAVAGIRRMKLPDNAPLSDSTARELATRDGIPLIVTGRVASAGTGFMVSANLVRADSGIVLVTLQQGANGAGDLLDAVDQVARGMRSRIGESLRSLARTPPLAQATTRSLDALREYTRAIEAGDARGDFEKGREHLRAALRADSTFAMAWRKLAAYDANAGSAYSTIVHDIQQAYRHRERLTERERIEVEAYYLYQMHSRAGEAYYARYPELSQNNRAITLNDLGQYAAAESVLTAEIARIEAEGGRPIVQLFTNLAGSQMGLDKHDAARRTLERMQREFPGAGSVLAVEAWVAALVSLDSGEAVARRHRASRSASARAGSARTLANAAIARGQLRRAVPLALAAAAVEDSTKVNYDPIGNAARDLALMAALRGNEAAGVRSLDSLAARMPTGEPKVDGADLQLAAAYAQLGRVDRAKAHLASFERGATREEQFLRWGDWYGAIGEVALAEGRADDAIAAFRTGSEADSGRLEPVWLGRKDFRLARAFDRAGQADSAIAHYEVLRRPGMRVGQMGVAPAGLVIAPRRLGELYEAKGDVTRAIERYEEFVRLWKDADPDLQPQVSDVRARIARLKAAEARRR